MRLKKSLILALLVASFVGCKEQEDPIPKRGDGEIEEYSDFSGINVTLRGVTSDTPAPERYVGRGFNLASYRRGNDEGICRPVLDMRRALEGRGWNPWRLMEESIEPMEIDVDVRRSFIPKAGGIEDISTSYFKDSMDLKLGVKKAFTLNIGYNNVEERREKTHSFESFSYLISHELSLYAADEKDCAKVFNKRFINDLKTRSAKELVKIYGTHVITGYYLGAYSRLVVSTLSSQYSSEETQSLAASIADISPGVGTSQKASQSRNAIRVDYSQGGSNYIPPMNLIEFTEAYAPAKINSIDSKAWRDGIDLSGNAFLSLPFNGSGIVPIPDLIEPINLKVKYISGIWYELHPKRNLVFVFCDPETYEPIKYNGQYISTNSNVYGNSERFVRIYYGNNIPQVFSEKMLSGSGADYAEWDQELDYERGWTFRSFKTEKYLCRDLKMRSSEEDTQGLRFWLLNPILAGENQTPYVWAKRMLKK